MSTTGALRVLDYTNSAKVLAKYGIQMASWGVAKSPEEAAETASKIGYPVAVKAISQRVSHKTEANAIRLGVKSDAELREAFDEVIRNLKSYDSKTEVTGVLIQEMITSGTEVIIGTTTDPQFGPVIMFGLGGIFVEVLEDVSFRVLPITSNDAEEMVKEIKGYKVLEGFRGKPRTDQRAIIDILLKVSRLSTEMRDWVAELDLNPVIVLAEGNGAKAVDVRLIVTGRPTEAKTVS